MSEMYQITFGTVFGQPLSQSIDWVDKVFLTQTKSSHTDLENRNLAFCYKTNYPPTNLRAYLHYTHIPETYRSLCDPYTHKSKLSVYQAFAQSRKHQNLILQC